MKRIITIVLPVAVVSTIVISLYQQSIVDNDLLVSYKEHVQRLLSQAEENSKDRIAQEKKLAKLREEINDLNNKIATLSNQSTITEERFPPDYRELESELRQQIIYEYELDSANENSDSRLELIDEITSLDPDALNEIMSLQRQFGPFLQSLDVSEGRMEEIVGVLTNYVAGQTQARQQVLLQANSEQIGRREIGTQMRAIMDTTVMYEALSYDLSQSEILLLQQTHSEQETFRGRPRGRFNTAR
ncbi:MAG: hypothetical protein P8N40_08730 [Gammaproteobacteria bacterium]|nr:hypothetical protein [Gammaproteobacteria bacterium]